MVKKHYLKKFGVILAMISIFLTRITWLIHTSFLPSSWNPNNFFALAGYLAQVHMSKKKFNFPPCGKGKREEGKIGNNS